MMLKHRSNIAQTSLKHRYYTAQTSLMRRTGGGSCR